jgi:hypothetical protein
VNAASPRLLTYKKALGNYHHASKKQARTQRQNQPAREQARHTQKQNRPSPKPTLPAQKAHSIAIHERSFSVFGTAFYEVLQTAMTADTCEARYTALCRAFPMAKATAAKHPMNLSAVSQLIADYPGALTNKVISTGTTSAELLP